MAQYELNIRDYIRVLRKRKLIIVFAAISMGFFSFVFATLQKPIPIYRAESSVKVEKSSSLTGLYLEMITYEQTSNLDTQVAIITSLPIMELAAKRLGLIDEGLTPQEIRKEASYINKVLDIKNKVSTSVEGYTNIINIGVEDSNPIFAQRLANTVAEVYKEENTMEKNKRIVEAKKYIDEQLKVIGDKVTNTQEELRLFREKNRIISIESQTRETLDTLTKAEQEYARVKQDVEEVRGLLNELKRQKSLPKEKVEGFYAEKVGPIFSSLNTRLVDLYAQRDLLVLDYSENHPEIQKIDMTIDKVTVNMIKHLEDHMKRVVENERFLSEQIKKTRAEFNALPNLGFELERIEHDLKVNKELYESLKTKQQEILIKSAEKVEEVTIVRPALEPKTPINSPTTGRTAVIGTVVGLILGLVIAFIFETIDTSIGTIEDVEALLGVPVVGVIPYIRLEEIAETLAAKEGLGEKGQIPEQYTHLITHFAPKSTLAESFRTLRTSVKFMCLEKGVKTVLVTSSSAGEGKSTVAVNLAVAFAQIGSKTLLVEADMRKPAVYRFFGIEREPGLSDVILGSYDWKEVVRTVTDIMMGKLSMEEIMLTPGLDNLNIITCGSIPPNPSEIINSQRMTDFVNQVKAVYDVVILDSAPILPATDSVIMGAKTDGVVILYRAGKIARGALKRAKSYMDSVKSNVLGVVLNGLRPEVSPDYSHYKKYYSYGGGKEEELPWYKKISKGVTSFAEKGKQGKWGWFGQWFKKILSFIRIKKIQSFEDTSEKEETKRWGIWIKVFLLVMAIVILLGGLLWQFEFVKM